MISIGKSRSAEIILADINRVTFRTVSLLEKRKDPVGFLNLFTSKNKLQGFVELEKLHLMVYKSDWFLFNFKNFYYMEYRGVWSNIQVQSIGLSYGNGPYQNTITTIVLHSFVELFPLYNFAYFIILFKRKKNFFLIENIEIFNQKSKILILLIFLWSFIVLQDLVAPTWFFLRNCT